MISFSWSNRVILCLSVSPNRLISTITLCNKTSKHRSTVHSKYFKSEKCFPALGRLININCCRSACHLVVGPLWKDLLCCCRTFHVLRCNNTFSCCLLLYCGTLHWWYCTTISLLLLWMLMIGTMIWCKRLNVNSIHHRQQLSFLQWNLFSLRVFQVAQDEEDKPTCVAELGLTLRWYFSPPLNKSSLNILESHCHLSSKAMTDSDIPWHCPFLHKNHPNMSCMVDWVLQVNIYISLHNKKGVIECKKKRTQKKDSASVSPVARGCGLAVLKNRVQGFKGIHNKN